MSKIRVSIIIPFYNQGDKLCQAVESTHFASHNFVEVIVVNDGSTDADALAALDNLPKGVQVLHQKNKGLAAARNAGIEKAKGEFILPLDADNTIKPTYFIEALKWFDAHPETAIVYANAQLFGEKDGVRNVQDFDATHLLCANYIDACAVFKKSVWQKCGGYDGNMPHMGHEDWEFWVNAHKNGFVFHHLNQVHYGYRVADNSMLMQLNAPEKRAGNLAFIAKKHTEIYQKNMPEILAFFEKNIAALQRVSAAPSEQSEQLNKSFQTIFNLQQRLNQIEASKVWKVKMQVDILMTKMRSNSNMSKGNNLLKKVVLAFSKKSRQVLSRFMAQIFKHLFVFFTDKRVLIVESGADDAQVSHDPYTNFLMRQLPTAAEAAEQRRESRSLPIQPVFSILMPVYNPPIEFFKAAIESIKKQSYPFWQLCLADDCSTDAKVKALLEELVQEDARISVVFRKENGHISAASNSALELAQGDFCVLMDQDDLLAKDALFHAAMAINKKPETDLIYTDEDKVDEEGLHTYPHFKPDWSPDNLLSRNYLGHLTIVRTALMKKVGGWRLGFEGSQDYDLMLRISEQTEHIFHIPRVLYHWRIHSKSAADGEEAKPYAYAAAKSALMEALERRGEPGFVDFTDGFRGYNIRYKLQQPNSKVSIIIPTKNQAEVLETCLKSIAEKSTHANYEIVLVDNGSTEASFFKLIEKWQNQLGSQFKHIVHNHPFNFSELMNVGRANATGDYLILLNNDTEVISPDWMEAMMEQAQRPSIGVVGVKLLYPNQTVQHAGVVMGLGNAAGHILVGENRYSHGNHNYVNLISNFSALTAACIMVRTSLFDEVGGFEENFAVEYNDVDFCLKVKDTGVNNIYLPHVELFHYESISRGHPHLTKGSLKKHEVELKKLRDKWEHYIEYDPCFNPNLSRKSTTFEVREE